MLFETPWKTPYAVHCAYVDQKAMLDPGLIRAQPTNVKADSAAPGSFRASQSSTPCCSRHAAIKPAGPYRMEDLVGHCLPAHEDPEALNLTAWGLWMLLF